MISIISIDISIIVKSRVSFCVYLTNNNQSIHAKYAWTHVAFFHFQCPTIFPSCGISFSWSFLKQCYVFFFAAYFNI